MQDSPESWRMKVVLFCGGLGTRLKEHSGEIPKPLVNIGYRPILWHLMRFYAHFGHKQFILCLGYRGDMIKEYFLNYNECLSNDFIMRKAGKEIQLLSSDIDDWDITFVETGLHATIGERLKQVQGYVAGEEIFMANYADGLSDVPLDVYTKASQARNAVASFLSVRTWHSFHAVHTDDTGMVTDFGRVRDSEFWLNGGFFLFQQGIFDVIKHGEELVEEGFQRLIERRKLYTYRYEGFWRAMDTFKDKVTFDRMYARGEAPWELWNHPSDRRL
jgi:glucose-1-phosphate cytidylyltransferase